MFPKSYTSEEIRAGSDMIVHPVSGTPMAELLYDRHRRVFYRSIAHGAWDPNPDDVDEPVIDVKGNVRNGDRFPESWAFDPYTGTGLRGGY